MIANHVLFYCKDVDRVCSEVGRVLKPGGRFVCGTYGVAHMQEVSRLVTQFDDRITLSGENLYDTLAKKMVHRHLHHILRRWTGSNTRMHLS